jgi:N-hydroxyarylamine O-acetyltransferase
MDPTRYLSRIGVPPDVTGDPDRRTLERLQHAHVTTVPFETLSITGDPFGDRDGEGVDLSLPALYEKLVAHGRGGFCFELNGLFGWLLAEAGFEVTRLAGRVVDAIEVPANHHPLLVSLDRDYVVDVGMGAPMLRRPLPLGDRAPADTAGVAWRVVDSDRPDADFCLQYRQGDGDWTDRYVFDRVPRDLDYFAATCDYLQSAPESGFTGDPVVVMATARGVVRLDPDRFTRRRPDVTEARRVDETEYHRLLRDEFGIRYDP